MTLGNLDYRIELDRPNAVHYGGTLPVSGKMILTYHARDNPTLELFGPLKALVCFHGRAKTKLWVSNGKTTTVYRGRQPLLRQYVPIHDGPIKLVNGQSQHISFAVTFPTNLSGSKLPLAQWLPDSRFISTLEGSLPPSMRTAAYSGFGIGQHRYECFVEYRISPQVAMDLDVRVPKFDEDIGPLVRYEQPKVALDFLAYLQKKQFRDIVRMQNEYLLPEDQRPSGFKQKAKALFSSSHFPTYVFDVIVKVPTDIIQGQPICFDVNIIPNELSSTAQTAPEIRCVSSKIAIYEHCEVRAELSGLFGFRHVRSYSHRKVIETAGSMEKSTVFSPANDFSKTITAPPISGGCSTFTTFNIAITYVMTLTFELLVTERVHKIKHEFPIRVLPPLEGSANADIAHASSSAGPSNAEPLPEYTAPPSYDFKGQPDSD